MTTKRDIEEWFDRGVKIRATRLIVVCDTFEHEDYPIFVHTDAEFKRAYDEHNGRNMQRVMEVYDLKGNKEVQLNEAHTFRIPK